MNDQIRSHFPQIQGSIYLDSATKGLMPQSSIDILVNSYRSGSYTVRKALHTMARSAEKAYFDTKTFFGNHFGVADDQLAWMPGADVALTQVFHSLVARYDRPRVITTIFEHHSILAPLLHLSETKRIDLTILDTQHEPCLHQFIGTLAEEGKQIIVALGHTTQVLGLYRDIDAISKVCRENNILLVVDFSRTAGQHPVSLKKTDIAVIDGSIDLLGPTGTGLLYVSNTMVKELENPFPTSGNIGKVTTTRIDRISGIEKFELGTPDIAGMQALRTSIQFLTEHDTISHRQNLMNHLVDRIDEIPSVSIVDPLSDSYCGNPKRSSIVSLNLGFHSHDVALYLDELYKVQVRSGLLCSHPGVLAVDIEETIQVATHIYNTTSDIDTFITGLQAVMGMFGE